MITFDATTARLLEDAYQGADITFRRRTSFQLLDARNGHKVLDLGCGNGLMTLELSRRVGDTGQVFGVDPSSDMLNKARERCEGRGNVTLTQGTADKLDLPTGGLDRAVSVQVFEYIENPKPPLIELRRVMRPGGRVVISDIHWDTMAWYSDDPDRMASMITGWDAHLARRDVPATLQNDLAKAGFRLDRMVPVTCCATRLDPDGLPMMLLKLMEAFALSNKLLSPDEVQDWSGEQLRLSDHGRFFFSLTHFACSAVVE